MKNLFLYLFVCIIEIPYSAFSQLTDAENGLTISTNVVQSAINELNVYADYRIKYRHSFGINISHEYEINNAVFILSTSQAEYPGRVWHGTVSRVNYKFFLGPNRNFFICVQGIYKKLSFINQNFLDEPDNDELIHFTKSEKAYLLGGDFLIGYTFIDSNTYLELFSGIGYRHRVRDGVTTQTDHNFVPSYSYGPYYYNQEYATFVFGIKTGFSVFFKKKEQNATIK